MLEDAGYEVVPEACDGLEATRPILDERDVPVVALTGYRKRGDYVQRAVDAGAVGHVLKPFSRLELVSSVSHALAERADRDEYERRIQLTMVESMLRGGSSERDIVVALERSFGRNEPQARSVLRRLFGRLA